MEPRHMVKLPEIPILGAQLGNLVFQPLGSDWVTSHMPTCRNLSVLDECIGDLSLIET
jgi:hypothetical protein